MEISAYSLIALARSAREILNEGANILTRNVIIFGQVGCLAHPYLLREMRAAVRKADEESTVAQQIPDAFRFEVGRLEIEHDIEGILHGDVEPGIHGICTPRTGDLGGSDGTEAVAEFVLRRIGHALEVPVNAIGHVFARRNQFAGAACRLGELSHKGFRDSAADADREDPVA